MTQGRPLLSPAATAAFEAYVNALRLAFAKLPRGGYLTGRLAKDANGLPSVEGSRIESPHYPLRDDT